VSLLVGLGAPDHDEQAVRVDGEVSQVERSDLTGAQCGGVAEEEHGAVADADAKRGVDACHDPCELGDGERVSQAAGRGAHDPTQTPTDPGHDRVGGRIA
jgi:hypothetical protein